MSEWQPTMILRVKRYKNYSYAETQGVVYEDTLQQLWIRVDEDYDNQEWRDVPVVEPR